MHRISFVLIAIAVLTAACGTVAQPPYLMEDEPVAQEAAFDNDTYQLGVALYLNNYCGSCHALDAANTWGNFGPSHNGMAIHAAERLIDPNYMGEATTVEEYLYESIVNPLVYFVPTYAGSPHRMPAYTNLSEDDVNALVYLLAHQTDLTDEQ